MSKNLPGHRSKSLRMPPQAVKITFFNCRLHVDRGGPFHKARAEPRVAGNKFVVMQAIWSREHVPNLKLWSRDSLGVQAVR